MTVAVNDWGKLVLLTIITCGLFVLRFYGDVSDAAFYGLLGAILGYVTGNGALAARHQPQSPLFAPSRRTDESYHGDPPGGLGP